MPCYNRVVTLDRVQQELELLGQRPLAPPEGVVFSVTQLPNQAACLEQQEQALELLGQLGQELSAPPTLVSKRSAKKSFLEVERIKTVLWVEELMILIKMHYSKAFRF